MIALKKFYGDELLRLALVLSLFKSNPEEYPELETQQLISGLHISNGSDQSMEYEPRTLIRPRYVHPKSLDNVLIDYERRLFEELNSLGRYNYRANNERMWYNQGSVHTYLVNDVATDTVAPGLPLEPDEAAEDDVSADDNVAQEVKVTDEDSSQDRPPPDLVVTLSEDFLHNHTESDVFAEIASRSFDVNEFLNPSEMQIKREPEDADVRVRVKIERQDDDRDDLYGDNAIDDFVPYFSMKSEKMELGEPNSVFHQNMADLQDYGELFDDVKELRNDLECLDVKQQQENLEQYLLENTPLDAEAYELAPMFEEELVLNVKRERASTSFTASSSGVSDMDGSSDKEGPDVKLEPDEGNHSGDELTQEDMDLIEVLWKQDVDMGFSLEDPTHPTGPQATKVELEQQVDKELKRAEKKIQQEAEKEAEKIEKVKASLLEPEKEEDPWAGLSYTVDTETGEYVIQGELPGQLVGEESFDLLEEALQLVELGDEAEAKDEQPEAVEGSSSAAEMLHPAMRHVPHHPLAHYHNQSLMRSMSVEQRWQDLASLLTIPPPPDQYQHYHQHPHSHPHPHPHPHAHHHNISPHGAAGAGYAGNYHAPLPPVPDQKPHEVYGAAAPLEGAYKVESAHHPQQHDPLYYQNSGGAGGGEMVPAQDGFLQSILNDEDLQLMDMAMNEGMYTMRMLDSAAGPHAPQNHSHLPITNVERDSASDSAVSSMGSERVPSLSDGEWCDGSDSAQEFHSSKFRPYEGTYPRERASHAPQKKHHMFGKRSFQEPPAPAIEPIVPTRAPGVVKYECEQTYHHDMHAMHNVEYNRHGLGAHAHAPALQPALDLNAAHSSHSLLTPLDVAAGVAGAGVSRYGGDRVRHNHTYSAPPPAQPRHHTRDKRVRRLTDGSTSDASSGTTMSRDEKRAKALGIPLEVHDIINLPMDEFNERLSKHDLSEAQLSLIRDIRRRGKNKVAAQNCRKRKLDQITSLADEVRTVRDRKARTQRDHHSLLAERQRIKERFAALYRHVFQNLRDSEGRPLSSHQYSLQQAADGNVVLVPKMPQHDHPMNRTSDDEMDRKAKNYEQ